MKFGPFNLLRRWYFFGIISLSLSVGGVYASDTVIDNGALNTRLLQQMKDFLMVPPIDEAKLDQNTMVYLTAGDAPEGVDYREIGKRILRNNYNAYKEMIDTADEAFYDKKSDNTSQDYTNKERLNFIDQIDDQTFTFSCIKILPCLKEIEAQAAFIEPLLLKNKTLLSRYHEAQQWPYYESYLTTINAPSPSYSLYLQPSQLILAKAILDIKKGEIAQGIAAMQEEYEFYRKALKGQPNIIDVMVSVRAQMAILSIASELSDTDNKSLLNALAYFIEPLSAQEDQALLRALIHEIRNTTYFYYSALAVFSDNEAFERLKKENPNKMADDLTEEWRQEFIGDAQKAIPRILELIEAIKAIPVSPPESYAYYSSVLNDPSLFDEKDSNEKWGLKHLRLFSLSRLKYLQRTYDLQMYRQLVAVKLESRQKGIALEEMPQFLSALGDKAINKYTGKVFEWKAKEQKLCIDWLDKIGPNNLATVCVYFP